MHIRMGKEPRGRDVSNQPQDQERVAARRSVDSIGAAKARLPKSILDPGFVYINSINTSVKATFDRIRRLQREAAIQRQAQEARDKAGIVPINRKASQS